MVSTPSSHGQEAGPTTTMTDLPSDLLSHILRLLDGPALASVISTSSHLHSLSHTLWRSLCHASWPSTADPNIAAIISSFPDAGFRSFFSDSFPLLVPHLPSHAASSLPPADRLISAVDLRHGDSLIFSKVVETETRSSWFLSSPFRVDALDRTEFLPSFKSAPPSLKPLDGKLTLTWVVVDPVRGRAANFSSRKPVSVQRHWLSGELQVRFATTLSRFSDKSGPEPVQVGILVTCEGGEGGDVRVKEVSMQVEDTDGMSLNGKDSLVILQGAMEGERRRRIRRGGEMEEEVEEERRRYMEFVEEEGKEREEDEERRKAGHGLCGHRRFTICFLVGSCSVPVAHFHIQGDPA